VAKQVLRLTAMTPGEVSDARHALQRTLESWGCGRVPDALLALSELGTNAVVHGGGAPEITISHGERTLRLEVHDQATAPPAQREPDGAFGGFGLNIISEVSTEWGWAPTPHGKVVWSVVPCRPTRLG
jgi:anti-sigma regulatory factor (Ser/Thr protein kinase)